VKRKKGKKDVEGGKEKDWMKKGKQNVPRKRC
jgi:hypothetical protein